MAVRLNGSSYLSRTANLPPGQNSYTACGWAVLSVDRNAFSTIVALTAGGNGEHILCTDSDGTTMRLWSNVVFASGTFSPGVGVPFFWAITGNGTNAIAYFRTAAQNAFTVITGAGNPYTLNGVYFGDNTYSEFLDGLLWNVKLWDRPLSASELLVESFFERPQFTSGLNLWWPLSRHTDLADRSGNGRNPTVSGTLATNDSLVSLWRPSQGRSLRSSSAPAGYTLDVNSGSYAVTGSSANTLAARNALVTPGSYALTGSSTRTLYRRLVAVSPGAYSITGSNGTLLRSYPLSVSPGSYSITGADGRLIAERLVGVSPGSYEVTGSDVELTYTPVTPSPEIVVTPGSYSVVGSDASLVRSLLMSVTPGAYSLTGANAGLAVGRLVTASPGSYAVTGSSASLVAGRLASVTPGSLEITGSPVTLTYESKNKELLVEPGHYDLTGYAATLEAPGEDPIELLGGGPGLPKKRKKLVRTDLDKDSYLYRLLSPEQRQVVTQEVAEVIEAQAIEAVEQPKKPAQAKKELRSALKDEGIAYREAYREVLALFVQEQRRQEEEEEEAIAVALASLL